MGMKSEVFISMDYKIIKAFTDSFPTWRRDYSPLTPGNIALSICGSVTFTYGMVVADSGLNQVKTNVRFPP